MSGFWPLWASVSKTSRIVTASHAGRNRLFGGLLLLLCAGFAPTAFAATGTCGGAASQGVNGPADFATYCWIDFTNYNNTTATSAGGQAFTITLTGGSTLSFTLKVTTGNALTAIAAPTWTGAALGQAAFITIPGKPAIYQTAGGTSTVTLSNLVLTVGSGTVPYAIVAADAESTNNGESLSFTTNGNAWTLLASMAYSGSTTFPTLSGTGTATVTETGVAGNVGAYAFATTGSPTTISSTLVGGGLQGIAFAVKFHAVDFAINSSHTGSFNAGGTGSYTLTATNNGPDQYAPTDTVTVTDTLPTGETYVSASGSGWSCGAVGQLVTCTASNVTVNSGSSLPAITLNVSVTTDAAASLTNTATVASNPNLDYNTANNTATDVTTIVVPNLITSTKTVANMAGGDAVVGSTLQYTITLINTAAVAAAGASVTDDVPGNLSGFTVTSFPSGATNSSTGAGTGANGDGQLNITGITVPANSSVAVIFTAQVATGTADCTEIDNTAAVNTPNGSNGATPSSNPIFVAQSSCTANGNKILYLTDTGTTLTRVPPTANTTGASVPEGNSATWKLTPTFGKAFTLSAGQVKVQLMSAANGGGGNRSYTVALYKFNGTTSTTTQIGTNSAGTGNFTSTTLTLRTSTVTVPLTTFAAKDQLILQVNNTSTGGTNRNVLVAQMAAGGTSIVPLTTPTVINVDSVTAYSANYSSITQPVNGVFLPGSTVFICAVVSDPFGSADTDPATGGTAPQITITDPNGTVQTLSNSSMTKETGTTCNGATTVSNTSNPPTATEAYEYSFPTSFSMATGFWTVSVTATEGTEKAPTYTPITHTANGSFDLEVPSLLIVKSVSLSADPTGSAIKHSIPGATVLYTIQVQNSGRGTVDSGTLVISDPIPTNTALSLPAKPPFTFSDPGNTSGLSVLPNDGSIVYSNNGGSSYTYTPSCTRPCTDSAITNFKITLTGTMNGKTGSTTPSFSVIYSVVVQ